MAFTKFAKLEVLEVKGSATRQTSASLSKIANLGEYRTDDGYMDVRVRAISSRVNKNHDGWPASELKKAYRTFVGKPIFVDHHNSDPKRARGVVLDADLHIEDSKTSSLDPYYATAPAEHLPPTWIELLLEVDAKKFPKLAKAIIAGEIDGVSMGANVEMSKCSHCGNEATAPEQFCKHIQSKGAYFDYHMPDGTKTSKRSYEDCYGVGFFEISFVFDPADETALRIGDPVYAKKMAHIASIREEGFDVEAAAGQCPNCGLDAQYAHDGVCPQCHSVIGYPKSRPSAPPPAVVAPRPGGILASTKTAEKGQIPQSDMTSAPDKVNTLRQEQVCPICGSDMEDGVCEVCNYEEPPEGFQNPDLEKAKAVDKQMHQELAEQAAQGVQEPQGDVTPGPEQPMAPMPSGATPATASTTRDIVAAVVSSVRRLSAAQGGGRINTQERPILPATRQLSDKPIAQKTVSEAKKPVESNTHKENMTDTIKTADGATAQGEGVQAEKRVDVEGVGAVTGDPLSGIDHENVEKDTGDFVAPHTDTWSGNEGDSLGQQDAVTSDTGDFFTVSSEKTAAEAEDNAGEDAGSTGGAEAGGKTWDKSDAGFPDHDPARVDVAAPLKEEVGAGTETDSTEEFRSLKHTDPVTSESANEVGGPIGTAIASAKAFIVKAFKVAETEISLGLTDADKKFERVAELETATEAELDAQLSTLSRVKTAGLKKTASTQKTAGVGRLPSFSKSASFDIEAHSVDELSFEDSIF